MFYSIHSMKNETLFYNIIIIKNMQEEMLLKENISMKFYQYGIVNREKYKCKAISLWTRGMNGTASSVTTHDIKEITTIPD